MDKITSIAISGQNSTGKTTLCTVLSKRLQWNHVKIGQVFRGLAKKYNLEIEQFGSVPDDFLMEVDSEMQKRMASETSIIWDGRLSCFYARDRVDIFKIFCKADLEVRSYRASVRDKVTIDVAKGQILSREEEEKRVFTRLYNLEDPYDKQWIDLEVDTSTNTPEEIADFILTIIAQRKG